MLNHEYVLHVSFQANHDMFDNDNMDLKININIKFKKKILIKKLPVKRPI